jgi:hypothetical protein
MRVAVSRQAAHRATCYLCPYLEGCDRSLERVGCCPRLLGALIRCDGMIMLAPGNNACRGRARSARGWRRAQPGCRGRPHARAPASVVARRLAR